MKNISKKNKTPVVIATGFTSAYLGDERSLREFIIGDHVLSNVLNEGKNAVLYLINDSYDPLKYSQLSLAVDKDEKLIEKYKCYCGHPISEVPDPFGCHSSYAEHFTEALLQRLRSIDIHPVVMDAYKAYKANHYADYINITLQRYEEIQNSIASSFKDFSMKNLFKVQCTRCSRLDVTNILEVGASNLKYYCESCEKSQILAHSDVQGKLCWKIDCAARWHIYSVDMETFSKAHTQDLGSIAISSFISKNFFGGKVPKPIKYGTTNMSREISYRLLEILPPAILKKLFTENISRDITLNKDSIAKFCRTFPIKPGKNYVDFVTQELPHLAVKDVNLPNIYKNKFTPDTKQFSLVYYANRYSGFFFNKEYRISLSDTKHINGVDKKIAETALDFINYSLFVRDGESNEKYVKSVIMDYLQKYKFKSEVYPFLRRVFGQAGGASISTLLATLPHDYLTMVKVTIGFYINKDENS